MKNSAKSLFKCEIQKSFALLMAVFFISVMIIAYTQVNDAVENFITDLEKDKIYLNSDLDKIHLFYENQLRYIKNQLDTNKINKQNIKSFFDSNPQLLIDRSAINTVLVLNNKRQLVFSDLISDSFTSQIDSLRSRKYLDEIEKTPNKVVFGEIVQGAISRVMSIPIGISIEDENQQYIGSIIFSVNLETLSNNISKDIYKLITIEDFPNKADSIEEKINDLSSFVFNKIILGDSKVKFSIYNNLVKKYSVIEYNLKSYRDKAIKNIASHSLLIFLILSGLFYFYYNNILKPLKPSLEIINNSVLLFPNTRNLIGSVVNSIANQSKLLEQKEYEHKNQVVQIMSIICSTWYLTNYVKRKLEYLTEEIGDISNKEQNVNVIKKNKDFEIEEIKEVFFENEKEVSIVLDSFNRLLQLLELQKKENVNIIDLLYSSNIRRTIINNHVRLKDNDVDKVVDYSVFVYKTLFYSMIEEILMFDAEPLRLTEVNILEGKRIEFVFVETGFRRMLSQHEILTLSRLWAIFNDIQVTIEYYNKKIKVFYHFK